MEEGVISPEIQYDLCLSNLLLNGLQNCDKRFLPFSSTHKGFVMATRRIRNAHLVENEFASFSHNDLLRVMTDFADFLNRAGRVETYTLFVTTCDEKSSPWGMRRDENGQEVPNQIAANFGACSLVLQVALTQ